jgi:hypothetical protein
MSLKLPRPSRQERQQVAHLLLIQRTLQNMALPATNDHIAQRILSAPMRRHAMRDNAVRRAEIAATKHAPPTRDKTINQVVKIVEPIKHAPARSGGVPAIAAECIAGRLAEFTLVNERLDAHLELPVNAMRLECTPHAPREEFAA